MGSKKKKKGGGRRGKGRASSKDHNSRDGDDNELLSEEITAVYVNVLSTHFLLFFDPC